mgnify:CR=1 FL=1
MDRVRKFKTDGWNCRWYPDTSTLVMSKNGCFDRAFEPTALRHDLSLEEHIQLEEALGSEYDPNQTPMEMYNGLLGAGEDPSRAAHLVDMEFGFTDPMPDPFAPQWDRLAEEEPVTGMQDSRESAERPAIQ